MAYTNIDDPSAYFQVALYTGTGSTQSITNDGNSDLQPDWVWVKKRNGTESHALSDSTRGTSATLFSDLANVESSSGQGINSFNTDGFQVGTEGIVSDSGNTFVAWQWKANGGTTSSNTAGNVTNTLQTNTTAGFSISTFTSASSGNTTIGHGLGVTPDMFIVKARTAAYGWWVYHKSLPSASSSYLTLNGTDDYKTLSWGAAPTSSILTLASGFVGNNISMVCYAFAEKQGYSKFGKYAGNAGTDGVFVYTGFKPAFVIIKRTDAAEAWVTLDTARNTFNGMDARLFPNQATAESTSQVIIDSLSNGFKLRTADSAYNGSGASYIYMAFAENPFTTSTGIPTTAR